MEDMVKLLKSIYIFESFTESELKTLVPYAQQVHMQAHETLFNTGDPADAFYLIKMGTIKLTVTTSRGVEINVQTLGSGSYFGEITFLDGATRSATMESMEPTDLIKISYKDLHTYLDQNDSLAKKFYYQMALFTVRRLRKTTEDLANTREMMANHDKHLRTLI